MLHYPGGYPRPAQAVLRRLFFMAEFSLGTELITITINITDTNKIHIQQ